MAGTAGTVELIAREIATALQPLEQVLADGNREDFLAGLGFRLPGGLGGAGNAFGTATLQLGGLGPANARLADAIAGGGDADVVREGTALLGVLTEVFSAFDALTPALTAAVNTASGLTAAQRERLRAEAAQMPRRLLDFAVISYLQSKASGAVEVLRLAGIVDDDPLPVDADDPDVLPGRRRVLHINRFLAALTDPGRWLRETFGFGDPGFDAALLLPRLGAVLEARDLPFVLITPPGGPPVFEAYLFRLAVDGSTSPPSATMRLRMPSGENDVELEAKLGSTWTLAFGLGGSFDAGLEARIQPPVSVELSPPTGALELAASASATAAREDGRPVVLLGQTGSSRLEVDRFVIEVGVRAAAAAGGRVTVEPTARIELAGGHALIDLGSGDGFVRTITGGGRIEGDFEVRGVWAPSTGLRFEGGGGLELALPVNAALGPVELTTLFLAAGVSADGTIPVEVSAAFSAGLGPIRASVERVGVVADLAFPGEGGNLGPVDLAFRFKPPTGVGLEVDAGLIAGGGFLRSDPERGEYAGALSLEFAGFVELNAIGLISTRMPDGSSGFSLLIVITAEFGTGIQLGLGFTLLAVGGLIGLNRGMDLNALAEGVRTGAVESVMFPRDVVANAPRIISDLRRFFPPEDGTFLVGPMAKIGWGTPALITVSLGVIIEIPPGTVAIVGVLECILPSRDLPLLVLKINFVGALEPDKQRLWFYAQLFESRILFMTIDGGMGLLVEWGDDPDLVLTVGGFHPSFRPPPLPFPVPPRVSVDVLNQPGQLIRVSGYFAVTSNTAQFGARAELRLGFSDFGLEGHLAFDALFQFSPFRFLIQISASISLKAFGVGLFGIHLRFALEGPAPWRAKGRGSISLLFFEISADFDISWGEDSNPALPPVEVLALLANEISKVDGWETRLPPGGVRELVTLRKLDENEDDLVLHPRGTLVIRQRAIPLDVRIDRVGAQRPADGVRFSVAPSLDSGLVRAAITGDQFAMAQFQDMDDAAKLTRPAYENQDAGLELAAAGGPLASVRVVRRSARYEQIIIDSKRGATGLRERGVREVIRSEKRLVSVSPAVFEHLVNGSSTSRSPLARQVTARRQPFADAGVRIADQRYVLAYRRNNVQALPPSVQADRRGTSTFRNRATAVDALADWVADEPALADALHVIPVSEMAGELAVPGSWAAAGALPVAVSGAEPVRLATGKVLLAGGRTADGAATGACALFDPVAGRWAAATSLTTARRGHSATLLADGRVLAVGGVGSDGAPLDSAEVFDPVTGTWSAVPRMTTARHGHTATLLPGGAVLVAGGTGTRGAALYSVEIGAFQAGAWTWTSTAPMGQPRTGHRAVRVGTHVLVVGGALTTGRGEVALAGCETYDPTPGTWTPTANDLGTPRTGHQATLLADGSVLVTGGDPVAPRIDTPEHDDPPFHPDGLTAAERYDPAARTWRPVADLPGGRTAAAAVPLRSGRVLVLGGTSGPARDAGYRSVVSHDPTDGTWTAAQGLAIGRWDAAAVELADGRVLVAGGRTRGGTTAAAETFHP
jgi:N-acetylneuraminic acid mutarotase